MEGHTTNDGQRNIDININHRVPKMEGQMTIARSESMTAIQEHLKNVVIPVLYDDATQGLDQKGTCTLIDVGHDIYLLSAQHVFEGVHHERLKIPANVYGPKLIELWPFDLISSTNADDDIILLKMNTSASEVARCGWQIVEKDRCRPPSQDALFAISGYPSCLLNRSGGLLGGALVTSYVERMAEIPHGATEPVNKNIDLFLSTRMRAQTLSV
jgi:hypothetical protein